MANNMYLRFASQRTVLIAVFVICFLALIASFRALPSSSSLPLQGHPISQQNPAKSHTGNAHGATSSKSRCDALPQAKDTLIIVKTGANEVYEKLATQLLTSLSCYSDILIFSDLAQSIGGYEIHDALANVTEAVKKDSKDFDYYRTLQEYDANLQDVSTLRKEFGKEAWNLDKFKFLHMLEQTWKMRKGRKWYVFIEADTYLVQSNLVPWLAKMDHTKPWYLGSPTYVGDDAFSHGGSGYILSGEALRMFADGDEGIAQRYDEKVKGELYGDLSLMKALRDKNVKFTGKWPMLQGEKPSSLPFGQGPDNGSRHWCQAVVTMHHVNSDEASKIWEFEGKRKDVGKPLLFEEIYTDFVSSHFLPTRDDWYNLSDDQQYRAPGVKGDRQKKESEMSELEKNAYKSFEDCGKACKEQEKCYQYVFHDGVCGFSWSFRLGRRRTKENFQQFKSGFMVDRIQAFAKNNHCKKPMWL